MCVASKIPCDTRTNTTWNDCRNLDYWNDISKQICTSRYRKLSDLAKKRTNTTKNLILYNTYNSITNFYFCTMARTWNCTNLNDIYSKPVFDTSCI